MRMLREAREKAVNLNPLTVDEESDFAAVRVC